MENSTFSFVVALLGATVCADTLSSETHIASKMRGRVEEAITALEGFEYGR